MRTERSQQCYLAHPRSNAWPGRPDGIPGQYSTDRQLILEGIPGHSWEFLATGTGVTGLTATVKEGLRLQVNHSGAYDDAGIQRPVVLHLDWADDPTASLATCVMSHDLQRSLIVIAMETPEGMLRAEIRAHMALDVIRVDLYDERAEPQSLAMVIERNHPHQDEVQDGTYLSWHTNATSIYNEANAACGFEMEDGDLLLGRSFGLALRMDGDGAMTWMPGRLAAAASAHRTLWIVGGATQAGEAAWKADVLGRLGAARALSQSDFVAGHEAWWQAFWDRSWVEFDDPRGRYIRQRAAVDCFRYYTACSAGEGRETPLRYMNDLLSYEPVQRVESVMDKTTLGTYQAVFGALRTGDLGAVRSRVGYYGKVLPLLRRHSQARFGHAGAVCPSVHNLWGGFVHWDGQDQRTEADDPAVRYGWTGNLWMLLLMCDYVGVSGDGAFADDELQPFAWEVLTFFAAHYREREDVHMVLSPGAAGETWSGVRNSAETICALRAVLPRLISLGQERGWDVLDWQDLLAAVPPIPRGKFDIQRVEFPHGRILPGNLLVPAEDLSQTDPPTNLSNQHTELYAIWPAKLMVRDVADRAIAQESYDARVWPRRRDGWNLDMVHAATLQNVAELDRWYPLQFEGVVTFPCGLAQETSPKQKGADGVSLFPGSQGLGTVALPVIERLLQDYPDLLIVLPAWPSEFGVRYRLFSPFAGAVEVEYVPGGPVRVQVEREITVTLPDTWDGEDTAIEVTVVAP